MKRIPKYIGLIMLVFGIALLSYSSTISSDFWQNIIMLIGFFLSLVGIFTLTKKVKWSPENPRLSCQRPFNDLQHIFIFTDKEGKTTLDSPIARGILQDTVEMPLDKIIGHVPFDIIGRSDAGRYILHTQTIPDSVWDFISTVNPTLAEKAKTGVFHSCVRPFKNPKTNENVAILLIYK